jgi:hypothetical protein
VTLNALPDEILNDIEKTEGLECVDFLEFQVGSIAVLLMCVFGHVVAQRYGLFMLSAVEVTR